MTYYPGNGFTIVIPGVGDVYYPGNGFTIVIPGVGDAISGVVDLWDWIFPYSGFTSKFSSSTWEWQYPWPLYTHGHKST